MDTDKHEGNATAEALFAMPQFNQKLKRISQYSSLVKNEALEVDNDDQDILPKVGYVSEEVAAPVFVEAEEDLRIPSVKEIKEDFVVLSKCVELLKKQGVDMASQVWSPVRDLVESFVSSSIAPKDVGVRYDVLKPIIDLFEANKTMLIEQDVIGDSVEDWLGSVDTEIGEFIKK